MSKDQETISELNLPPTILVVFGITGDLAHRYLLPALSTVAKAGKLPQDFKIIGASRRAINLQEVFVGEQECLRAYSETFQFDPNNSGSFQSLKNKIEELSRGFKSQPEVIYYLSVPPDGVLPIIQNLGQAGLNSPQSKLLLEKPFGVNLESACTLIDEIAKHFPQEQVFRIDHYLAKEMAQNIVVFLGSNPLIRDVWNNRFVQKIEIVASEQLGIANRANFYDSIGALCDFTQSHLLQLAALVLMEPCSNVFKYDELPARRLAALRSLKADLGSVLRGQYQGYKDEVNNPGSVTETFASLKLSSNNPRWSGVPITLTTGKNLNEKLTQIRVYFKKTDDLEENLLVLRVQPNEGIELNLWVKQPGYERQLQKLPLDFSYGKHFGILPDAYEQVLIDAMNSNRSLFAGSDEVLASWEILQPVLDKWAAGGGDLVTYQLGGTISEVL